MPKPAFSCAQHNSGLHAVVANVKANARSTETRHSIRNLAYIHGSRLRAFVAGPEAADEVLSHRMTH